MTKRGIEQILVLMTSKLDIFLEYEKITESLLHCSVDEIEATVGKRDALSHKIDNINEVIGQLCIDMEEDYPHLQEVLKNQCSYESLSQELKVVFNKGMEIYSVINRIQNTNNLVMTKLQDTRKEMLEQIATSNNTQTANLHRYLNSTSFKGENISLLGDKYSKI